MKNYEKESLLKNFFVFFSLLEILLVLLFIELYHTEKRELRTTIFKTMQVCSYTLECPEFIFDFTPKSGVKLNELYSSSDLYAYFPVPQSEKYNIRIAYPAERFKKDLQTIRNDLWLKFIGATLLLMAISLFFTLYSLKPIREALKINDEFVKDILHDFNTPISSIVLNLRMYQDEYEPNIYFQRISKSVDTILLLQNNLKSFLHHSPMQNSTVDIAKLSEERIKFMQNLYPRITFVFQGEKRLLKSTNTDLLTRILDNILSNAAKYNRPDGKVTVTLKKSSLTVTDTGKGIANPQSVTKRYYKEQTRGVGLGLHIVQKLTDELNIGLNISSVPNRGTTVTLDLKHLKEERK